MDICVCSSDMIGNLPYHSFLISFIFHETIHFLQGHVDVMQSTTSCGFLQYLTKSSTYSEDNMFCSEENCSM